MKATYQRQYRKSGTGNLVFVYNVSGTPEQLAAFKAAKGAHYKEDENKVPLFFCTRYAGKVVELRETKDKTNWVADTSELDQMKSLVDQYGIDIAMQIMNKKPDAEPTV